VIGHLPTEWVVLTVGLRRDEIRISLERWLGQPTEKNKKTKKNIAMIVGGFDRFHGTSSARPP
jgi:hypothetical protein